MDGEVAPASSPATTPAPAPAPAASGGSVTVGEGTISSGAPGEKFVNQQVATEVGTGLTKDQQEAADDAALDAIFEKGKTGREVQSAAMAAIEGNGDPDEIQTDGDDQADGNAEPAQDADGDAADPQPEGQIDADTAQTLARWRLPANMADGMTPEQRTEFVEGLNQRNRAFDYAASDRAHLLRMAGVTEQVPLGRVAKMFPIGQQQGGQQQAAPQQARPKLDEVVARATKKIGEFYGDEGGGVISASIREIAEALVGGQPSQDQVSQAEHARAHALEALQSAHEKAGFAEAAKSLPASMQAKIKDPSVRSQVIETAIAMLQVDARKPGFDIDSNNLTHAIPKAIRALFGGDIHREVSRDFGQRARQVLKSQPPRVGTVAAKPTVRKAEDRDDAALDAIFAGKSQAEARQAYQS